MNLKEGIIGLVIGLIIGLILSGQQNTNKQLEYSDEGYPKNCRAIIKENIDGYRNGMYSTNEIINSINRNCGEFGQAW
jgi:hypothetical protein